MKNAGNSSTAKVKNLIVLILATVIVIGLMSSTAVRLVTATYLMQSSRNSGSGNKVIDLYLDSVNKKDEDSDDQNADDGSGDQNADDGAGDQTDDNNKDDDNQDATDGDSNDSGSGDSGSSDNGSGDSSEDYGSSDDSSDSSDSSDSGDSGDSGDSDDSDDSGSDDGGSSDSGSGDMLSGIVDTLGSLLGGVGGSSGDSSDDAPLTEEQIFNINKNALKSYSDVLVKNKSIAKPGFSKVTQRSLSLNGIASAMYSGVTSEENVSAYLAGETVDVSRGSSNNELCLENLTKACIIGTDDATVEAAVKTAHRVNVKMGYIKNNVTGEIVHGYDKYADAIDYKFDYNADDYTLAYEVAAVKVYIEFNDETNPAPIGKNGKTDSFIASVFPVVTGEQVLGAINQKGATSADVTYKNCSVELYYNIENAEIYSLTQNINYEVSVKDGYLTMKGNVSEVNKYSDFVY